MSDLPHVVAVMITGKHPQRVVWARAAAAWFHAQTYPADRRHLLIVQDLSAQPLFAVHTQQTELCVVSTPSLATYEASNAAPRASLGELRNRALAEVARYYPDSWVLQWDDDDYAAPDRIAAHVAATQQWLQTHATPPSQWATTLRQQLRFSVTRNICRAYRGDTWGIFGTVLHSPASTAPVYEAVGKHEDSRFLKQFQHVQALELDPRLYVRIYNGLNTWDETHIMGRRVSAPAAGNWHKITEWRGTLTSLCHGLAEHAAITQDTLRRLLPT